MSIKTFFINSTLAQYTDEEFSFMYNLFEAGVFGDNAGAMGLTVAQNGAGAMSVLVAAGKALVSLTKSAITWKVVLVNTASVTLNIGSNVSGVNRVDAIIVRVDKDAEPNALKSNIGTIEVVAGTGITALSDAAITTALGSDGFYRLANVTVANGAVSILTGSIADTRVRVTTNNFATILDNITTSSTPVGSVIPFAGNTVPNNFLPCDGAAVARTGLYANLFAVIGTTYGVGDGVATFNVPDMQGLVAVGIKTANATVIEDCEDPWNESVASNVASGTDASDFKVGTKSAKFDVDAAVSSGTILATEVISSLDLRGQTHVRLWIKSSVTAAAGDLQLLLDDTANCASPLETINIPALVANIWTRVQLPLANPQTDTAIISIGLKYVTDLGACTIRIDDVEYGYFAELGAVTGEDNHQLNQNELPSHFHPVTYQSNGAFSSGQPYGEPNGGATGAGGPFTSSRLSTLNVGSDAPHNNRQRSMALKQIIRY